MKRVTFVPRHVAERICGEFDCTISIMPPGEYADITGDYLPINFDDTETPCAGLRMFGIEAAIQVIAVADDCVEDGGSLLVHCEAGMSRSAAIAKWIADNMGYELWLHPEGIGTTEFHNRHVYRTLDAAEGNDLAAYYADLERQERMME